MPTFFGPIQIGPNAGPNAVANFQRVLQNRVPGFADFTTYPGPGGTTTGVGFTSTRADLFPGQMPSDLSGVTASLRRLPMSQHVTAPPESVTGTISRDPNFMTGGPQTIGGDAGGVSGIGGSPIGSVTGVTGPTLGAAGTFLGGVAGPPGSSAILGASGQALGTSINPSGVVSLNTGQGTAPGIAVGSTPGFNIPGVISIPSLPTSHTLLSNIDTFQNLTPAQLQATGQVFSGTTANPNNTMTGAQGPISTNFTGGVNSPTASMNARAPAFSGIGAIAGPRSGDSPVGAGPAGTSAAGVGPPGVGQTAGAPPGIGGGETGSDTGISGVGVGQDAGAPPGVTGGETGGQPGIDGSGDGGGGGGAGGGDSVICTLFRDKGIVNHRTWLGTARFGAHVDDEVYAGYLRWAAPLVTFLRAHPLAWRLFYGVCGRAIAAGIAEMAHREGVHKRGSRVGRVILAVAVPVCKRLGRRRRVRRRATATA